ncbi:MAG: hypothetical protein LBD28_03040, partial [Tannerellaceae bacterium]|nr:hypothetical protein [Tannerellaceae bacterium]
MNNTQQWKGSTGGSALGQRALLILFKIVDVRIGYAIMALIVPFYILFHRKATNSIFRYFRQQWNMRPIKAAAYTFLNHFRFGQIILDRFAVFSGNADKFHVDISGNEHFRQLVESPKGFIIAGSHIGNFEIAGYLLRQNRKTLHALVYPGETFTVQQQRSRILSQNNISLIPVSPDMSHLIAMQAALRSGGILIIPADRMYGSTRSAAVPFLRGQARFPVGAPAMAITFQADIIAIFVLKQSARRYHISVVPLPHPSPGPQRENQQLSFPGLATGESEWSSGKNAGE